MNDFARIHGALLGLAYGDAIGFPALFHRFGDRSMPRKRHNFLWRTNQELDAQGIATLMLPFTHRIPAATLEPCPTDDTEWALLTLHALLAGPPEPTLDSLLAPWLEQLLPDAANLRTGFSERAAIENLQRGMRPPATGNDNPMHYADAAVPRAVAVGLYARGDAARAAAIAGLDASISQAEDGIWAAQAMAAAVALLATGAPLAEAIQAARACFPADSWLAHGDAIAQRCRDEAQSPEELALLLSTRLINTVYSYGCVAPETFPAALVLVEACEGELTRACATANLIPRAADSLPAMVGALCGALHGESAVPAGWRAALATVRGLALPFLAGTRLEDGARALAARSTEQRHS